MRPNSIGWDIAIGAGFLLGLALFIIGSIMLRTPSREKVREETPDQSITWPKMVDEDLADADVSLRLDMIERLSMVPGAWSRDVLERARSEENDARVVAAVEEALRI